MEILLKMNNNLNTIGKIITKLISNSNISVKLQQLDAIKLWEKIIGTQIQKYITEQKIYNKKLYVKVKSTVVRNELSYNKSKIINQINKEIGNEILKEIIIK